MTSQNAARPFDVILFGATGYVGRLVAEHFARSAPSSLRLALAGRDLQRLERLRADLAQINGAFARTPLRIADHRDAAKLVELASTARVICTTVGPYERLGLPVVVACARTGTHYCDITGEIPFMRASVDAAHAVAIESRARIVHACGFDSVPFDLGVALLREHVRRKYGSKLTWAATVVKMRGAGSPGGLETVLGRVSRRVDSVCYDERHALWTAPFIMAPVNTYVVQRTQELTGESFAYREALSCGTGQVGRARAHMIDAGTRAFTRLAQLKAAHSLIRAVADRKRGIGSFEIRMLGGTLANETVAATISGDGDPGCIVTAHMVAASALSLAFDDLPERFGVLTPAVAMGNHLVQRLRALGYKLDTSS